VKTGLKRDRRRLQASAQTVNECKCHPMHVDKKGGGSQWEVSHWSKIGGENKRARAHAKMAI
jgi:hypothetical protein